VQALIVDWEAPQARWPQGQTSVHGPPDRDMSGDPVIRLRFDGPTYRACPARPACTTAKGAPHQLTVRRQTCHAAFQTVRQCQGMAECKPQYAWRVRIERRLSPGMRRVDQRRSRDLGLARTTASSLARERP
jgi:DDE family transposase